MRRIIHNTTAIAACLSLLASNGALAETRVADAAAQQQMQTQSEKQPRNAQRLRGEIADGLGPRGLICADGGKRPCDDGVALVTPGGLAVDLSDSGRIVLADAKAQQALRRTRAARAGEQKDETGPPRKELKKRQDEGEPGRPEAERKKKAGQEGQKAEGRAARQAGKKEKRPDRKDDQAGARAPAAASQARQVGEQAQRPKAAQRKTEAEARPEKADRAKAQSRPKAKDEGRGEVARAPDAAKQRQNDKARADAAAKAGATKAERPRPRADKKADGPKGQAQAVVSARAGQDAAGKPPAGRADQRLTLAGGPTASDRAKAMPGLAGVLSAEIDDGMRRSQLTCLSGDSLPCADGDPLTTPKGVVVEEVAGGSLRLAPAKTQMFRVDAKGKLVPRTAEEGTRETRGAKEAARETRAATAAALQEDRQGKVTTKKVTKEGTRSSSEDFATSLRSALAGSASQPLAGNRAKATQDDGDDNDLTKALLLGLGALAVGSYLNNNRQVALSTPDRVVVTRDDGSQEVIKDEVALLRQPGSDVTTENFDDGSSRTVVTRPDGSKVVTIRDADLRVLRRTLISPDGRSTRLIDDTAAVEPVDIAALPAPAQPASRPETRMDEADLRAALDREAGIDRRFTLGQIRNIPEVRALVAPIEIDAITFDTGSAAIKPDQARQLSTLGKVIQDVVADNPREIFLVEGYTDTVGSDAMNLALSDRRAESVALALTEYFEVPPENLVVQGYGEQFLKIRAQGDVRLNRRASVRRITDLLKTAESD